MINLLAGPALKILSKVLPIVLIISIVGFLYYKNISLTKRIVNLNDNLVVEQHRNKNLSDNLIQLRNNSLEQAIQLEKLQSNTRVAETENHRLNQVLEGYKKREKIVVKKPTLVERRANDAVNQLMREYECKTGNNNSCKE